MPYDVDLPFKGRVQFDETGDFYMATGERLANQRIGRRIFTNNVVRTSEGEVVEPGDDPFNQDYGMGLGRKVDRVMDPPLIQSTITDVKVGLAQEEVIDQSVAVDVDVLHNRIIGAEVLIVSYALLDGDQGSVGFGL